MRLLPFYVFSRATDDSEAFENAVKEFGLTPKSIDKQFVFDEIELLYPNSTAEERADLDIITKHFGG